MPKTAYDEQLGASKDWFAQQRKDATRDVDSQIYDAWGDLSAGRGMTGSNIARVRSGEASARASALGGIDAQERMWLSNVRRMEEERKNTSTKNLLTTIGTGVGALALGALAIPTGGLSLAALPGVLSVASAGAGLGGFLGGIAGGAATGEWGGEGPATLVAGMSAAQSSLYQQKLAKLQEDIAGIQWNMGGGMQMRDENATTRGAEYQHNSSPYGE
jgi:hypothetical protein